MNRAIVCFRTKGQPDFSPAVYLHCNSGPECVYAFLAELARRGPGNGYPGVYAARFASIVGSYLDYPDVSQYTVCLMPPPASDSVADLGKLDSGWENGLYLVESPPFLPGQTVDFEVRRFGGFAPFKEANFRAVVAERKKAEADDRYASIRRLFERRFPFLDDGDCIPPTVGSARYPSAVVGGMALSVDAHTGDVFQVLDVAHRPLSANPGAEGQVEVLWLGRGEPPGEVV